MNFYYWELIHFVLLYETNSMATAVILASRKLSTRIRLIGQMHSHERVKEHS